MLDKIKKLITKKNKTKIVCLTAYSKNIAEEIDKFTDLILVGDSLGSVLYNFKSTRQVSLKKMIEHSKSVRSGISKSIMIVDMPYNTYRTKAEALKNCKKVMKETKCDGVKLEGGSRVQKIVEHLIINKIPVLGHLGITPQTVRGKFKSKGKSQREKKRLLNDAVLLEKSGAFAIVLECIKSDLSKEITSKISIPTIGIGSSNNCDGQILVTDDILGLTNSKIKFVKKYIDLRYYIRQSVNKFKHEVKTKKYPSKKYSY
tara:strand:+ start:20 stop:796 length:777 start_codon:yes stop_codon:yes gene_type:complete